MRVVIFEHNDPDGPEEVDVPDGEIEPPVCRGLAPHFSIREARWMVPVGLASSDMSSAEITGGFALTVRKADGSRRTYRSLDSRRELLGTVPRKHRGKKLRAQR